MCTRFVCLTLNVSHVKGEKNGKCSWFDSAFLFRDIYSILQKLTRSPSGSSIRRARNNLVEQRGSTSTTGCITSQLVILQGRQNRGGPGRPNFAADFYYFLLLCKCAPYPLAPLTWAIVYLVDLIYSVVGRGPTSAHETRKNNFM